MHYQQMDPSMRLSLHVDAPDTPHQRHRNNSSNGILSFLKRRCFMGNIKCLFSTSILIIVFICAIVFMMNASILSTYIPRSSYLLPTSSTLSNSTFNNITSSSTIRGVLGSSVSSCKRFQTVSYLQSKMNLFCNSVLLHPANKQKAQYHTTNMAMMEAIDNNKFDIQQHPEFNVLWKSTIKEYDLYVQCFEHKVTKAKVLSLSTLKGHSAEKVFNVVFKTPIEDSTGIPHILEHSVLMGSDKYPVKEAFVELMKGSMYTFLNAFTYQDRTCYPVASVNDKDFYNLADVYMESVFRPRAIHDEWIFKQEGWHLEVKPSNDSQEDAAINANHQGVNCQVDKDQCKLLYQGVVLNEMKGVYSSPDSLDRRFSQQCLFPDLVAYSHDSGGDPKVIPELGFEQFKQFYHTRYHPGNALFFFHGPDDVNTRLNFVAGHLKNFSAPPDLSKIEFGFQTQFSTPKYVERAYPSPATALEDFVSLNWVLDPVPANQGAPVVLTAEDRMTLTLLSHLLIGTPASPLYKALVGSNLGKSLTGYGADLELKHATFTVGLKGVKQTTKREEIEDLVLSTLDKLANEGFSKDSIEAALNTIQFQLRELNTGTFPRGLAIILTIVADWIYSRPPLMSVEFEDCLLNIRQKLSNGEPLFENAIRKYLLNNTHRVTVRLVADPNMEEREGKSNEVEMGEKLSKLGGDEIKQIQDEAKELKERQLKADTPEALATLPKLTLEDLDDAPPEIPITVNDRNGITVLQHELPTSGILYMQLAFSLSEISLEELPYLSLFSRMAVECGTSDLDPAKLVHLIGQHTGGISLKTDIRTISKPSGIIADPYAATGFLAVVAKATTDKVAETVCLISKILTDSNLGDKDRAIEIIKEFIASTESKIRTSGHSVCLQRLYARHTAAGYAQNVRSGLDYLQFLRKLLVEAETNWSAIEERLCTIRNKLLRRDNMIIDLTGDTGALAAAANGSGGEGFDSLIELMPKGDQWGVKESYNRPASWIEDIKSGNMLLPSIDESIVLPMDINYVCLGGRLSSPGDVYSGTDAVITQALGNYYLWDHVRVAGGAYGVFFKYSASGIFGFSSYRDPNLIGTLEKYSNAPEFLESFAKSLSKEDLTKAIIAVLRQLDAPIPNDQMGTLSFWQYVGKESQEDRLKFRNQVLNTTPKDFKLFGERLERGLASPEARAVVVGSEDNVQKANASQDKFKFILRRVFDQ